MTAYVLVEVKINQPERYEQYKKMASEAIAAFGGKYLARGGSAEALEGDEPHRIVILEFESVDQAKAWHASDVYREALELRTAITDSRMIVVDGVS
ncbi:MAG: DUF1330 domain-containing protein [Pseudomonadota bacterium]